MNQYIVVCVTDMLQSDSDGPVPKCYRGLDRDPWKCVDDQYYAGVLPAESALIRANSFKTYLGNLSFGTIASLEEARKLLSACAKCVDESEIVEVAFLGKIDQRRSDLTCPARYGLDVYADGFGSLLRLGIFEKPGIFREFFQHLNRYGLFDNLEALRAYATTFFNVAEPAGLERIDSLDQVCVYAICPV